MITVLAEKPSVARELATLLGATGKKDGYFEGNGYTVTWALGHLVTLGLPEDYGFNGFHRENLPILPHPFRLFPKDTGKDVKKTGSAAVRQLHIIGTLFKACEGIIAATDAGREGELIFRNIYEYLKCDKPFRRLWVNSLTESALKQGFENLRPGSDFDPLYLAAHARSRSDWLLGINATQALSVAAGSGTYSLGRVQTPTLSLICQRYTEHRNFSPEKYFQLKLSHSKSYIDFKSTSVLKWPESKQAEEALKSIIRKKEVEVRSVDTRSLTDNAPLLYDLTDLQKAANTTYGLTASETLEIAQRLYENKFITYPRTGSKYITADLWAEVPGLVRGLEGLPLFSSAIGAIKFGRLNRHIVNAEKVTDHHGLLITEKVPSALPKQEMMVYQMIAFRLLEAISESCIREVITVGLQVLHYEFTAKSSKVTEPGWRAICGDFGDIDNDADALPELREGDALQVRHGELLEKLGTSPQLFTEATLLSAMEHAGKLIDTPELKSAIQDSGLGTPATRAGIIEALFERQYIERKGKTLVPTAKGLTTYGLVRGKEIASVAMTAHWEAELAVIEQGGSVAGFQQRIEVYTRRITEELLSITGFGETMPELRCPKCADRHLVIDERVIRCPDSGCGWSQWRMVCGILLETPEIEKLISERKTSLLKGLRSKSGKLFDAYLVLDEKARVIFLFEK